MAALAGVMAWVWPVAYVPFRDPIEVGDAWLWLLIPLVVVIAVVYKTIKTADLRRVPVESAQLTASILLFMAAAAAGLWVLTEAV